MDDRRSTKSHISDAKRSMQMSKISPVRNPHSKRKLVALVSFYLNAQIKTAYSSLSACYSNVTNPPSWTSSARSSSSSGSTFKETWGETLGAGFGITGIIIGTGLVLVAGAIAISAPVSAVFPGAGTPVTVVLVALAVVFTYLLSQTIWGSSRPRCTYTPKRASHQSSSTISISKPSTGDQNRRRHRERSQTESRDRWSTTDPRSISSETGRSALPAQTESQELMF